MQNMKVIKAAVVILTLQLSTICDSVAIQPSTFGGVVDGFGRFTNSIKVI